ncbi:YfiR family protein [Massilia sp. MP_M2]|uniref:YfiR family protein n=1 Tax=Massilia sp. MP_M2 TaxID=3071713 RepID=UPI00319D915B
MTINQPACLQRRKACLALMLPLLAGVGRPAHALDADAAPALERRVKAAFLYKFLGYADFPAGSFADATTPVSIGVVGADNVAAELTRIAAGRMVAGRMITVRALREQDLAQPLHVLFVAGQDDARAARLLRAANALLTVTECDGGLRSGSIINFTIVDDRVRFDVSLDAAEKKNVKLSSRLLTVANRVQKGAS